MWQLRYIYDHLPTLTVNVEVKEGRESVVTGAPKSKGVQWDKRGIAAGP
jgi:hypothetical protein